MYVLSGRMCEKDRSLSCRLLKTAVGSVKIVDCDGQEFVMVELTEIQLTEQKQALGKAMNLFWERGAEVASYNDLVNVTGLSRKALYAYWPDKDALIADTLKVYYAQLVEFLAELMKSGGKQGLIEFWESFEAVVQRDAWSGCYLFRTSVGPMRHNIHVQELYKNYGDYFANSIATLINTARAEGEVDAGTDPIDAGLICFSLVGAISTIGGQSGYDSRVARLFDLARTSCGLESGVGD